VPQITFSPRIRKSPFYEATVRDGVTDFTVYNKMLMPTSFGDLRSEYDRLLGGVAMWDVSVERQIQLLGPDAAKLAQYLSSRDLTNMVIGQGKYVAMCDHDGRILNDPILLKLAEDRFWFSIADSDMLLWCRAVASERGFEVHVSEPDVSPLAVQGPLAEDLLADLFGDLARQLKYFWFEETHLGDIPVVLCRSGWSKQGGFELFLQDGSYGDELYEKIKTVGQKYNIGPGAPNHVERVESGLLSWGGDTTPDSNPFEAGMARFVDTDTRVDYIGKDALQKIASAGPRRLLTGLLFDANAPSEWPLPERMPVTKDGTPVGTTSAIVHSHRLNRTIGMAQLERSIVEAGSAVELAGPDGVQRATPHPLPFL